MAKVPGVVAGNGVLVLLVMVLFAMVLFAYVTPVMLLCMGVLKAARLDKVGFTKVDVAGSCEEQVSVGKTILRLEC